MLYSKSAEYAIQAMIYLAEQNTEKPIMIRKIAKDYGIPYQFLAKIIQVLVKNRFLKATRGRTGGVSLYREAKNIYLHEIIIFLLYYIIIQLKLLSQITILRL